MGSLLIRMQQRKEKQHPMSKVEGYDTSQSMTCESTCMGIRGNIWVNAILHSNRIFSVEL
jgi:hypothetical protein